MDVLKVPVSTNGNQCLLVAAICQGNARPEAERIVIGPPQKLYSDQILRIESWLIFVSPLGSRSLMSLLITLWGTAWLKG